MEKITLPSEYAHKQKVLDKELLRREKERPNDRIIQVYLQQGLLGIKTASLDEGPYGGPSYYSMRLIENPSHAT